MPKPTSLQRMRGLSSPFNLSNPPDCSPESFLMGKLHASEAVRHYGRDASSGVPVFHDRELHRRCGEKPQRCERTFKQFRESKTNIMGAAYSMAATLSRHKSSICPLRGVESHQGSCGKVLGQPNMLHCGPVSRGVGLCQPGLSFFHCQSDLVCLFISTDSPNSAQPAIQSIDRKSV